ncbi:hypothetical protein sos41_12050 [Alphaproteobacteria bacterium SO-S41]|nr:hypothetical protein sos41_12050 [Alphaproteobacteria bacterium SO-S41]
MRAFLLAAAVLVLSACVTPQQQADACATARQAVSYAESGLGVACTKQSKACDTAGLVLKSANMTMALMCPAGREAARQDFSRSGA